MIKTAVNSISAGILIAIGGSVYLACDNKYAGAALFWEDANIFSLEIPIKKLYNFKHKSLLGG